MTEPMRKSQGKNKNTLTSVEEIPSKLGKYTFLISLLVSDFKKKNVGSKESR